MVASRPLRPNRVPHYPSSAKPKDPRYARNSLPDDELDHTPLPVGVYKGRTPSDIAESDPSYLIHMAETCDWKVASDVLLRDCMENK